MGIFDKFKKKPEVKPEPPKKPKPRQKTAKEIATERGEPYVNIVGMDLDSNDISNGAFELDWNQFFIAKLIKAGYVGKTDEQIVDQWFQNVCRNVVLETYEQYEANNPRTAGSTQRRDLGDGYSEFS